MLPADPQDGNTQWCPLSKGNIIIDNGMVVQEEKEAME